MVFSSISDELFAWLTQDSEVIDHETKSNQIIESPSHPSSFILWIEENSSNHISHDISPINLSLNLWSEDSFDLSNVVVDVENYG